MDIYSYVNNYENFLSQTPGFLLIHNLNSRFIFANNNAVIVMGFKSIKNIIGIHYADMKCKASEDAEDFVEQDRLVLKNNHKINFLSANFYKNDNWMLCLGEKSLLLNDDKNIIGLTSYIIDVTNHNLVDLSRFILSSSKFFIQAKKKSFSYIIEDGNTNSYKLSDRQIECLFFLLRGKSDKEIGNILHLSPRTIESYINEIKFKMNCLTRSQLIEKSFNEGLFNLIPKSFIKNIT